MKRRAAAGSRRKASATQPRGAKTASGQGRAQTAPTTSGKSKATTRRANPARVEAARKPATSSSGPDALLRRIVLDFVRFLTTTPILRLPEHLRAGEARRRLVDQLEVLEDTLRDGADVEDRLLRLKALNIAHALRVALDQRVSDEKVDALDHAACRLIDDAGAVVPVPGRQGRLAKVNRESWEKHQLLDAMDLALDVAGVPADVQENGRLERRDIEAQWSALDRDAPADAASIIAAIAIHKMEAVLLRATTRPVSADADERNAEHRAVARAVRHLIRFRIASPQNVAFVALSYFGTPWKLRKNFFKGVEESWRQERDEMMAKYGHLLRTSRREG